MDGEKGSGDHTTALPFGTALTNTKSPSTSSVFAGTETEK